MQKYKILIVEDEHEISGLISRRLDAHFYDVDFAKDGREALIKIASKEYDLITLDLMIPHIDGFEICQEVRKRYKDTLIIVVSALETEEDKINAYKLGADDYVCKPFSPQELGMKIKVLLKRRYELQADTLQIANDISLDIGSQQVRVLGTLVDFTPSEFVIFNTLFAYPKKVFSRLDLAQIIYDNYLGSISEKHIDSHIYRIRKKLAAYDKKDIIKTIHGVGFIINEH